MRYPARILLPGGGTVEGSVGLTDDAVAIEAESSPVAIAFSDLDDVMDADFTLRLTDYAGRVYELSMLGKAYGQLTADIKEGRNAALERDLLLRGVHLTDTYPGVLHRSDGDSPVQIRLYEDLLVVVPDRGLMFGVPFSSIEAVDWDSDSYRVTVRTDEGEALAFGKLAKRTEEFRNELRRLLDALDRRTAATIGALAPSIGDAARVSIAAVMRDGRAVQQRVVDALAPGAWPALEQAVVAAPELRSSYDYLKSLTAPGSAALGIKSILKDGEESAGATDLWYFCPLTSDGKPANAVAQEVTSQTGHATYVFRLMDPSVFASLSGDALDAEISRSIFRLNRALLLLNFRREPLYAPAEEIQSGQFSRYRVALRSLPYLRWAREALIGRAVHNAGWEKQITDLVAKA